MIHVKTDATRQLPKKWEPCRAGVILVIVLPISIISTVQGILFNPDAYRMTKLP